MKFIVKPTLVAVAVLAMMGCQEQEKKPASLETDAQKQGYALGASIGSYISTNLKEQEKVGVTLDKEVIIAGFTESINGKSQYTPEEFQEILNALGKSVQEKNAVIAEEASAEAILKGEAFLAENAKVEGVVVTESGLQYQVITDAEGPKPVATDTVRVHYHGTLIDGTVFDSSYDRNEPAEFPLNRVIAGWTEGLQYMSVGSTYKFVIPSDIGYGPQGGGPIPGNSTLVFKVELLDITTPVIADAEK